MDKDEEYSDGPSPPPGDSYASAAARPSGHSGTKHRAFKTSSLLKTFQGPEPTPAARNEDGEADNSMSLLRARHPNAYNLLSGNIPHVSRDDDEESSDDEAPLQHKAPKASPQISADVNVTDSTVLLSFPPRPNRLVDTPDDTSSPSSDMSPQMWFSPAMDNSYYYPYGNSPLTNHGTVLADDSLRDLQMAQRMNAQMSFQQHHQRNSFMYAQAAAQYGFPQGYVAQRMQGSMGGMYHGMYPNPMQMQQHAHHQWAGPGHMQGGGAQDSFGSGMDDSRGGAAASRPPMMNIDTSVGDFRHGAARNLPMSPIMTGEGPHGAPAYNGMQFAGNPYSQIMYANQQAQYAGSAGHANTAPMRESTAARPSHPPVSALSPTTDSSPSPTSAAPVVGVAAAAQGSATAQSGALNSATVITSRSAFRSTRRKRFKASGESVYPKGISKAGNSWRIQVQVLSDEIVSVPVNNGNPNETKTVLKKYRFSRNMSDYKAALWLYEVAILLSDRPATVEDQIATGNFSVLIGQGLVTNMDDYYEELGRQVLTFARQEPGNVLEVPMAIRAYDNITARSGLSLAHQGRTIVDSNKKP